MDIIDTIFKFYRIIIDSEILSASERGELLDLLYNALEKQPGNQHMTQINIRFLYRASENEYIARSFHGQCDNQHGNCT